MGANVGVVCRGPKKKLSIASTLETFDGLICTGLMDGSNLVAKWSALLSALNFWVHIRATVRRPYRPARLEPLPFMALVAFDILVTG